MSLADQTVPRQETPTAADLRDTKLAECERHLARLLARAAAEPSDYRAECIEAAHARLEAGFGRLVMQHDPEFWRRAAGLEAVELLEEGLRPAETCDCGRGLERGRCPSFCGEEGGVR